MTWSSANSLLVFFTHVFLKFTQDAAYTKGKEKKTKNNNAKKQECHINMKDQLRLARLV